MQPFEDEASSKQERLTKQPEKVPVADQINHAAEELREKTNGAKLEELRKKIKINHLGAER